MVSIRSIWLGAKNLWFYLITAAIGLLGIAGLGGLTSEYSNGGVSLAAVILPVLVCLVAASFPVLVVAERVRDHRFFRFLADNLDALADGVTGPDGEMVTFDTVLVRYEANLSLFLLGACFESGLYRQGKGHGLPKLLYTTFSLLFGWWSTSWQDWLGNAQSIGHNLAGTHQVTLRELIAPESLDG
jgi:hypothetical protein